MSDSSARDAFVQRHRDAARHARGPAELGRADLDAIDRRADLRRDVAIASMGNAAEGHSSALARDIDDRTGFHVAARVANLSGARYLGHVPYATDRLGGLARVWSPTCLPVDECVARTTEYLRFLLAHVERPRILWLLSGHGGNGALVPHLPALAAALGLDAVHYALALRVPAERPHLDLQHAGTLEHGVARALGPGCFDEDAHARLEARLAADLEATLKDEPALGGMAGYYLYGDARFDAIRDRYPGVKAAVAAIVATRAIGADAADGALVLETTAASIARDVIDAYDAR